MTAITSTDISIKRISINAFDLENQKVKLSEAIFPLSNSTEVISDFFIKHIIDTREGKSKSCKFRDSDATAKVKINRHYNAESNESFIKLASELTMNLFSIMVDSSSTSSGTFFVLDILIKEAPWIFMIKLDPKNGVQIDLDDLIVKVLENVLPDSGDRVHKCALIKKEREEGQELDLYVLDKQVKQGETAKFFLSTFLQAEELLNDAIISRAVVRFAQEKFEAIVPENQHYKLLPAIDREFSNGSRIDLKTSFENLFDEFTDSNILDREIILEEKSSRMFGEYMTKYPDHNTSYTSQRSDSNAIYKDKDNKILFRYDRSLDDKIDVDQDEENYLIKISKDIDFSQILK